MSVPKIEKLEDLLSPYIDKTKTIVGYKASRLTAPGENYGSILLKLDIILKDKNGGNEENFSLVAKTIPETEFFRVAFNIQVTTKLEVAFYDTVVPTLQNFQRERGIGDVIDFFPKLYGARINLDGKSEVVDENSVLLLENLHTSGYRNCNRFVGLDLDTTKLILRDLAKFHAVPLALKLMKPEVFEKKVKPYFACFHPENPPPPLKEPEAVLLDVFRDFKECVPLIPILEKNLMSTFHYAAKEFREPFATISHRDMWVNNFMVRFEEGKPVGSKFVDFQNYTYDSPVRDLTFFLNTSVQFSVLKENLDYFIQYYHDNFIRTLEELKCPIEEFSFDKFVEEIKIYARKELGHSFFMALFIVCGKKGAEMETDDPSKPPTLGTKEDTQPETREKVSWILQEYYRRKWISF